MKTIKLFGAVLALLLVSAGCKQDTLSPINKDDTPPDPVTNVTVENLPGGATITYDLPESKNLLYVKAVFEIGPENNREVKTSYYNNSLTVAGFPDTTEYEGQLYAVSRSEVESEPVAVKIQPLTPPVTRVFESLTMQATFGGVRVNFENEAEADVVISVLASDSLGNMTPATNHYTQSREGTFAARGFPAELTDFSVFVRDRWDNLSDTVSAQLLPLYEEELDKADFSELNLPTDTYVQHNCCPSGSVSSVWDGEWNSGLVFHTSPSADIPQWFTFDMGVQARLSRFKLYSRPGGGPGATGGAYTAGDPRQFEIWGSNDPSTDGSWDNWVKLGDFESVQPSSDVNENFEYAVVNGQDFEFPNPEDAPSVRYLRFKTNETWGGTTYIYMSELTFWGSKE